MCSSEEDIGTVRRKHAGFGDLIQGGGAGGSSIWVIDFGDDPPHGSEPGGFPEYGSLTYHGKETLTESVCHMGLPPPGGGNAAGGLGGGRGIRPEE